MNLKLLPTRNHLHLLSIRSSSLPCPYTHENVRPIITEKTCRLIPRTNEVHRHTFKQKFLKGCAGRFPVLHTSATVSSSVYFYLFSLPYPISHSSRDTMIFNTQNALAVTSMLFAATSVAADGFRVLPRGSNPTLVGCYSAIPGYGSSKSWTYQSSGWCSNRCFGMNQGAFALTGASNCICGDTLPPSSDKVSSDKCNTPCSGWPDDMCM